jgi:hypothetical protein
MRMPRRSPYEIVFYCAAVFALAAATSFVFVALANFLSFTLSLTENSRLYDYLTEYAVRLNAFSQFFKQTVALALVFAGVHLLWRKWRKV